MYTCIYIYMYIYICVYVYIYIYMCVYSADDLLLGSLHKCWQHFKLLAVTAWASWRFIKIFYVVF